MRLPGLVLGLRSISTLTSFENFTLDGESPHPQTGGKQIRPPWLGADEGTWSDRGDVCFVVKPTTVSQHWSPLLIFFFS